MTHSQNNPFLQPISRRMAKALRAIDSKTPQQRVSLLVKAGILKPSQAEKAVKRLENGKSSRRGK